MKDNQLIVCRDVSLGYEGRSILSGLDLTISKGDYLCVVGDNGSGKSTLMRGLLGLIQPQIGTIEHAPALKHGAIGYLPQQTRAQRDFPATVLEVVLSGCLNRKGLHLLYTPAQRSEAMVNLGKLGILELKDACYRDLSGGQQQRVLLARALCAALLGVPLVLKRYSMIGDGLSHVSFGALAIAVALGVTPLYFSIPVVILAAFFLLRMASHPHWNSDAAIAAVKQLSADVGIPANLHGILKEEDIRFLAESAYADACRPGNPRDTSVEEIVELYKSQL